MIVKTLETTPQDATHWSTRSMAARGRAHAERGLADLAGVRAAAAPPGDLQALQGPAVCREGPRHRRALPEPARARGRAVRRREVARSRRWIAPRRSCRCCPGTPARATHDYKRHGTSQPVRRTGPHHRQGDQRAAPAATARSSSRSSCRRSTARSPPTSTSTSCSTTAARTRRRRSSAGSPRTPLHLHFTPTSQLVAEPRRALVRRTHQQAAQARRAPLRPPPQRRHPRLDRHLEPGPQPVRVDQDRRPDPRIDHPLLQTNQPIRTLGPDARSPRDARSDCCCPRPRCRRYRQGMSRGQPQTPMSGWVIPPPEPIGQERRGSAAGARNEDCGARAARAASLGAPAQGHVDRPSRGLHPVSVSGPRL